MEALIEALGKDPNVQRRKWAAAAAGVAVISGFALGGWRVLGGQNQICSGGPAKLAGIWDLRKPGEPEPARHLQIREAFNATGKSYARDVFATVDHALTAYAQSWANMHRDACEAAQVRREQSAEVMDLRMACLDERLAGFRALTDVLAQANGDVVEHAVGAVNSADPLDRCANVPLLRAVVKPPEDPSVRVKVEETRARLAALKARYDAGRWKDASAEGSTLVGEARAIGYKPLIAETLAQQGKMLVRSNDTIAAEKALSEAFWMADATRHDELRAETAATLVYVVGYLQRRFADAQRWGTTASAVLERLGGHELLQSWLLNDLGNVYEEQGKVDESVQALEKALALKTKVLGRDHPDVGVSEGNLAVTLQTLGRHAESLAHVDRAIALLERGLGSGHPALAIQLNNRGEVLNRLGRPVEARRSFERARVIWERELGPDSRLLAYGLTGIGVSYLAEGSPAGALVPLERALRIRDVQETDDTKRAETAFALARALWESNRDRGRARLLAERAKNMYSASISRTNLDEVQRWLAARGG
jgi:tetratricopeptide (TPR) repeat protein